MSAATELANAEADAVEAELGPDEDLPAGGEEEAEPEPEPEQESEESMQARVKKISGQVDGEEKRHEKRYREIFGSDFDAYQPCPLCQLAGYAFPYQPGTMPDEQRQLVSVVLGESLPTEYQQAPWAVTCETCQGLGEVLSGALTTHGRLIVCKPCEGAGWVAKVEPPVQATLQAVSPLGQPIGPIYPVSNDGPDKWDRPPGHAHYGIEPRYVTGGG